MGREGTEGAGSIGQNVMVQKQTGTNWHRQKKRWSEEVKQTSGSKHRGRSVSVKAEVVSLLVLEPQF